MLCYQYIIPSNTLICTINQFLGGAPAVKINQVDIIRNKIHRVSLRVNYDEKKSYSSHMENLYV